MQFDLNYLRFSLSVSFKFVQYSFPYVVFNQPMLSRNKVNHTEVQLGLQ